VSATLFLIPTPLGEEFEDASMPSAVRERLHTLRYFVVENAKSARAFLKQSGHPDPINTLRIETLSNSLSAGELDALLDPVLSGSDAGVLAEAGAPGVADPGATLVRRAHQRGLRVVPLAGPSALLLALMASGLEGQRFAFHGYLPVPEVELTARIHELETLSHRLAQTQIFIETPYRNDRLLKVLLAHARPSTLLCVATRLTQADEQIRTYRIDRWRTEAAEIGKRPSVFLMLAC
jgi:16S rRNA (cytidine1402-2'-O)-methyltransferase